LAKFVTSKLKEIIQLPNVYNIQNSISLIENLKELEINENTKLCSFDITNIYTNIPITEAISILQNTLKITRTHPCK
jgi:hypothetical protein